MPEYSLWNLYFYLDILASIVYSFEIVVFIEHNKKSNECSVALSKERICSLEHIGLVRYYELKRHQELGIR